MIGFLLLPLAIVALTLVKFLPVLFAGVFVLALAVFTAQRASRHRRASAESAAAGPATTNPPHPIRPSREFAGSTTSR